MSKHTPGPWLFESGVGAACVYALEPYRGKERNRMFAQVQGGPDTPREETVANGWLMTAAPDLLMACRNLLEHLSDMHYGCEEEGADCPACRALESSGIGAAVEKAERG